jgi:opacity protein-like surface antigen
MIRSLMLMTALGGLALFSTFPGLAQEPRFFVRGGLGGALVNDTSLKEFNGPVAPDTKVKFDPGVQFRIAGGFRITQWLSTELETGVTYNDLKSITGASHVDASLANAPILANLVLQCPTGKCRFTPYIGGGGGGSWSMLDAHDININGTHLSDYQSTLVWAYHGFGGVLYHINEHMGVSVEYRYLGTSSPTWDSDVLFGGGTGHTRFGDTATHSITAMFSFSF